MTPRGDMRLQLPFSASLDGEGRATSTFGDGAFVGDFLGDGAASGC